MCSKTTVRLIVATVFVAIAMLVAVQVDDAQAIPAFARKYSMTCTTCHAPFPRLKDYGDEFAGNGFVLADQDAPRYYQDAGDEDLDLIRDFPLAVRMEGFVLHSTEAELLDLETPWNLKLLSGGAVTDDIAYYFYFYLSERGEVAGVEDAYIMFNDLFGSALDVYVGQFQVSDPLFKRELRLTLEDYTVYTVEPGNSNIDLKYDRGLMLTYGFESGTDVIVEVVNGNGLEEAGGDHLYDDDEYKNFAGRISQSVGNYVRVGGFGYYGKEGVGITNEVYMVGPDATVGNDIFELNFQYMYRKDDNPLFLNPVTFTEEQREAETDAILAEAIYMPEGDRSKWYAVGLYNMVESDDGSIDYETITGHLGYMLRTNLRLVVENTYDIEFEENKFSIGFVSAF